MNEGNGEGGGGGGSVQNLHFVENVNCNRIKLSMGLLADPMNNTCFILSVADQCQLKISLSNVKNDSYPNTGRYSRLFTSVLFMNHLSCHVFANHTFGAYSEMRKGRSPLRFNREF